jgi:hypothetical protein
MSVCVQKVEGGRVVEFPLDEALEIQGSLEDVSVAFDNNALRIVQGFLPQRGKVSLIYAPIGPAVLLPM